MTSEFDLYNEMIASRSPIKENYDDYPVPARLSYLNELLSNPSPIPSK